MSSDAHLLDEETGDVYSLDNMKTSSYLRGQVEGINVAAKFLKKEPTKSLKLLLFGSWPRGSMRSCRTKD